MVPCGMAPARASCLTIAGWPSATVDAPAGDAQPSVYGSRRGADPAPPRVSPGRATGARRANARACGDICSRYPCKPEQTPNHSRPGGPVGVGNVSDSRPEHPAPSARLTTPGRISAPVPGWAHLVRIASVAALASDPPGSFACRARWGRLAWHDVRGPRAFVQLLWALEELSATLCEVCGAPAVVRDTWERGVHTLCPRHAVAIAAAGPRADDVFDAGWAALNDEPGS